MADHVAALTGDHDQPAGDIRAAFAENIEAQGSSMDAFEEKAAAIERGHTRELTASIEGFVSVDLAAVRSAFISANAVAEEPFPDRVGMILRVRPGTFVRPGDILTSIRAAHVCVGE